MGIKELKPDDFLYGRQGPWPQPCPEHPFSEAASVIHVPKEEAIDWWIHVGSRYIKALFYIPIVYFRGFLKPGLEPVSDQEFSKLFTNSVFSKFLKKYFSPTDREIFGMCLHHEQLWVCDFTPLRAFKSFKKIYVSASKVLLRKEADDYYVVSIYIEKTKSNFTPKDGDKWELAKYFALQGAALCSTLVLHPLQHFPMDSINAVTKTALPKNHLIFQLLYPHLRFTLYLEKAVLTFKSSLLQSKWWIPYAPYPGPYESVRELLAQGYRGIPGNSNYPAFKFSLAPTNIPGKYGEFQQAYFGAIKKFVRNILNYLSGKEMFYLSKWADYIAQWVPGFPSGKELMGDKDLLISVISYFIFNVSVGHTMDHYNFGNTNIRKVPMRLRVPPPDHKNDFKLIRSQLTTFWDFGKCEMARRIFFRSSTITSLINTDYDFGKRNEQLQKHVGSFKAELVAIDIKLKENNAQFAPLEEIAASIQF
jgi:hypothetical protein